MRLLGGAAAALLAVFFILQSLPTAEATPDWLHPRIATYTEYTVEELDIWVVRAHGSGTAWPATVHDTLNFTYDDTTPSYRYWYADNFLRVGSNGSTVIDHIEIDWGNFIGRNRTTHLIAEQRSSAYRVFNCWNGIGGSLYTGTTGIYPTFDGIHSGGDAQDFYTELTPEGLDFTNNTYEITWTVALITTDFKRVVVQGTEPVPGDNTTNGTGWQNPTDVLAPGILYKSYCGFENVTQSPIYGRYYNVPASYDLMPWQYTWHDPATATLDFTLWRNQTFTIVWGWEVNYYAPEMPNRWVFTIRNASTDAPIRLIEYTLDTNRARGHMNCTGIDPAFPWTENRLMYTPPSEHDLGLYNPYSTTQESTYLIDKTHTLVMNLDEYADGKYYITATGYWFDSQTGISLVVPGQRAYASYFTVITPATTTPTNTTNTTNTTTPTTPTTTPNATNASVSYGKQIYSLFNAGVRENPGAIAAVALVAGGFAILVNARRLRIRF